MADPHNTEERNMLNAGFTMITIGIIVLLIGNIFYAARMIAGFVGAILCIVGISNIRNVTGQMLDHIQSKGRKMSAVPIKKEVPQPSAQKQVPQPTEEHASTGIFGRDDILDHIDEVKKRDPQKQRPKEPTEAWTETIDWEEWIGQKLLQKVGIAIVLIGMAVFLKYSFDNGLIGELGRLAMSVLAAALLFGAGEKFHGKYTEWSYAFTGGALALLYFTVWAADVLYEAQLMASHGIMISSSMAMGLYSGITVLGVLASIRYQTQIIAWFAIIGGYVTPNLIQNASDPIGFIVYLAILTAGILLLAWFKKWKHFNVVAFLATQYYLLTIYQLGDTIFTDTQQLQTSIGFFALFGLLPIIYQFRLKMLAGMDDILLILGNGAAAFLAVLDALGGIGGEWTSFVCLALAAIYLGYASIALHGDAKDKPLINTYLVSSVALIALALYTELEKEWVAVGWSLFSVLLAQISVRLKQKGPWMCAQALLGGSLVFLMLNAPLEPSPEAIWQPFTSMWSIQSYIVFASLVAWIRAAGKIRATGLIDGDQSNLLSGIMHTCTAALVFLYVFFEATALDWTLDTTLSFALLAYASLALVIFWFVRSRVWLFAALATQILLFVSVYLLGDGSPLVLINQASVPFIHTWSILAGGLLALFAATYYVSKDLSTDPREQVQTKATLITVALAQVWLHGSLEIHNMWSAWDWSNMYGSRILSAWWILFSLSLLVAHIRLKKAFLTTAAALTLAIPFVYNMYIIVEYSRFYETVLWSLLPLSIIWIGCRIHAKDIIKAGVAYLGLTMIVDMGSHLGLHADLLRTSWWAIMGLTTMIFGFTEQQKLLRKVAIAIFAAAVCKLLLVDFSSLETPVRIGASISTGLLMIGASYLYQRFDKVLATSRS